MAIQSKLTIMTYAFIGALALASPATAQSPLEGILGCRTISDDAERLACFDSASERLTGEQAAGSIVVVSRNQIEQVEREGFGFSLPGMSGLNQAVSGLFDGRDTSRQREPRPHHAAEAPVRADADTQPQSSESVPAPITAEALSEEREEELAAETGVTVAERNRQGEAQVVVMRIERTREFDYHKLRIYMENGQVWEQVQAVQLRIPRRGDADAYIRRLDMGGYVIRINDTGASSRVRRIR